MHRKQLNISATAFYYLAYTYTSHLWGIQNFLSTNEICDNSNVINYKFQHEYYVHMYHILFLIIGHSYLMRLVIESNKINNELHIKSS